MPEAEQPVSTPEQDLGQTAADGAPKDPDGTLVAQDLAATNGVPEGERTVEPRQAEREPAGTRGQVR
jgi:hypothetical protein